MTEPFHAVGFMRRRREEIDKEDAELTWEEKLRKTLDLLHGNPMWQRVKDRVVTAGAAVPEPAAGGHRAKNKP